MNNLTINLHLFEGEGGEAAPAAQGSDSNLGVNTPHHKSGAFDDVVFGKQDNDSQVAAESNNSGTKTTSSTLEERRKAFQDMVNGEYKDIYTEETQRIINRRFKETAQLQAQVDKSKPILDMLMDKYKCDGDLGKLSKAIEDDDAYWEEAADEAGMTVSQFKQFQKLQRENAELIRKQQAQADEEQINKLARDLASQADSLKTMFPGFNMQTEMENPQFLNLIKAGTPVEHAYKVIHFDELMNSAINVTKTSTEKAITDNIRARGARPLENGASAQSASRIKDDVHNLTKAERAEIARRVKNGANITF